MKSGDLVKWTFAKSSSFLNKESNFHVGILIKAQFLPENSWHILLGNGCIVHGDSTEIELIQNV